MKTQNPLEFTIKTKSDLADAVQRLGLWEVFWKKGGLYQQGMVP